MALQLLRGTAKESLPKSCDHLKPCYIIKQLFGQLQTLEVKATRETGIKRKAGAITNSERRNHKEVKHNAQVEIASEPMVTASNASNRVSTSTTSDEEIPGTFSSYGSLINWRKHRA